MHEHRNKYKIVYYFVIIKKFLMNSEIIYGINLKNLI
jgi:hypothetical protein